MFRIYPSAYWEPLQVKKNQTLFVEESTSVLISRDILEVGYTSFKKLIIILTVYISLR